MRCLVGRVAPFHGLVKAKDGKKSSFIPCGVPDGGEGTGIGALVIMENAEWHEAMPLLDARRKTLTTSPWRKRKGEVLSSEREKCALIVPWRGMGIHTACRLPICFEVYGSIGNCIGI